MKNLMQHLIYVLNGWMEQVNQSLTFQFVRVHYLIFRHPIY